MGKLAICAFGYPNCPHFWKNRYCRKQPYISVTEKADGAVWVEECSLSKIEREKLVKN